jgi:hypothetical protein
VERQIGTGRDGEHGSTRVAPATGPPRRTRRPCHTRVGTTSLPRSSPVATFLVDADFDSSSVTDRE